MSISYDNIFTSNLWNGTTNGLNPATNQTTSQLWNNNLKMDRTYSNINNKSGSFFVVKTFNTTDSATIVTAINNRSQQFYFDQFGNLFIYDGNNNSLISFNNPLSFNNNFPGANSSKKVGSSHIDFGSMKNFTIIMSAQKTFFLYINPTTKIVQMIYNPIHRSSFQNYYNNTTKNKTGDGYNDQSDGSDDVRGLINKYCEINAVPGSSNGSRGYADSACICLGTPPDTYYNGDVTGECVDGALGQHNTNIQLRNTMGAGCVCSASACSSDLSNSSFVNDFVSQVKKVKYSGNCPPIDNTICSMVFNSAGNINATNTNISNQCGPAPVTPPPSSSTSTTPAPSSTTTSTTPVPSSTTTSTTPVPRSSTSTSTTPGPSSTSSTSTTPGQSSTSTSTTPGPSSTSTSTTPVPALALAQGNTTNNMIVQTAANTQTLQPQAQQPNNTLLIEIAGGIGGGIVLIIIIVIIVIVLSKKTPTKK